MTKEPTFEEGPFFLNVGMTLSDLDRKAVIWATDENTARSVYGAKIGHMSAYGYAKLIGNLEDVKRDYKLTNAQVVKLHEEGYLRL